MAASSDAISKKPFFSSLETLFYYFTVFNHVVLATCCYCSAVTWFLAFSVISLLTRPKGSASASTSCSVMSKGNWRRWRTREGTHWARSETHSPSVLWTSTVDRPVDQCSSGENETVSFIYNMVITTSDKYIYNMTFAILINMQIGWKIYRIQ